MTAGLQGWTALRPTDRGPLWENLVLDELLTRFPAAPPGRNAIRGPPRVLDVAGRVAHGQDGTGARRTTRPRRCRAAAAGRRRAHGSP